MGGEEKLVRMNDLEVAQVIQQMLAASGIEIKLPVILLIMRYQTNHYENIGALKISYE